MTPLCAQSDFVLSVLCSTLSYSLFLITCQHFSQNKKTIAVLCNATLPKLCSNSLDLLNIHITQMSQ